MIRRMTPAKLRALIEASGEWLEHQALPIDKLTWLYAAKNRYPGKYDASGNQVEAPAEVQPLSDFRTTYVRKRKTLAAKDSGYDYVLYGANADKSAWQAFAKSKRKGK